MLRLSNIVKTYTSGDVTALSDVSIAFRQNEFVSILGPSGCGKTTLLNIIGGLDRYTSGELKVRGVPTASFSDRDWDSYRNHSIGFVFQSYNLIPHQTVLANVELALTLSGVSKAERRQRAIDALNEVGLGDQLRKKPSQMSGGQMQRVAIARALVNDPDILLADEPTGALDSETSVQVMEILKRIAGNKLVIMVTHNPDLAEKYSTRIIRLLDGRIISDSAPYSEEEEEAEQYGEAEENTNKVRGKHKTSMSFFTALSLSLNNLMTKKARTILTAFAGSIGIIGIALILSLSNGINEYINTVQEDTLSAYPISIQSETVDMTSLMSSLVSVRESARADENGDVEEDGAIHSNVIMFDMMDAMMSVDVKKNNLQDFIKFINEHGGDFDGNASAVTYGYKIPLNLYSVSEKDENDLPVQLNPSSMFAAFSQRSNYGSSLSVWQEMIDNPELMEQQYQIVSGKWPESANEVILVVSENYEINDVYLYALGIKDSAELKDMMKAAMNGEKFEASSEAFRYEDIIGLEYALILPSSLYRQNGEKWEYCGEDPAYMSKQLDEAFKLKIVGIVRPNPEAVATSITGAVGYLPSLTSYIIDETAKSAIVTAQTDNEETDILLALPFLTEENSPENMSNTEKADSIRKEFGNMTIAERAAVYTEFAGKMSDEDAAAQAQTQLASMPAEAVSSLVMTALAAQYGTDEETISSYVSSMSEEEYAGLAMTIMTEQVKAAYAAQVAESLAQMTSEALSEQFELALAGMDDDAVASDFIDYMPQVVSESTYEENLREFGYCDPENPSYISIYASTFEAKDNITSLISKYNQSCSDDEREDDMIQYTDYVALLMSSVSTIINVISYVLIAFVSISLVVSSIMIGIITYISVLERTKEIGILRAVGASKKDISRVFNAETLIVGFTAGVIGIGVTLLLCIPANAIIKSLTDISGLARLPLAGGIGLVVISMVLTTVAGLIPSGLAAKKDPVEALRNE